MKYIALFLLFISAILFSCNSGTHQQTTTADSVKTTIAHIPVFTDSTHTDTVIHDINIEGHLYDITVLSDLYDSKYHLITDENDVIRPLTIIISAKENNKMVFKKRFPQNEFIFTKRPGAQLSDNGRLYVSLRENTRAPGMASIFYCIVPDGKGDMSFIKIMEYGEQSCIAINKNDSDVFRLAGDWNFDAEEGHFAEHRRKVYKYVLENGKYTEMKLGETTHKYSSEETMKDMVKEITEKEPQALEDIKLSDYLYVD